MDAEVIAAQNRALAKETENVILKPETIRAGVNALLSDKSKGFYLVAEENGSIVGQLMITVEWSDWRNKPVWWVQSVYVQKEWRKKSVFTKLLNHASLLAHKQDVAFLRLYAHKTNRSAHQVYEKTGWEEEPYLLYHRSLEKSAKKKRKETKKK
jgi:GNAT superfamily N-acetyltransferase